jgi:hypothetical protein
MCLPTGAACTADDCENCCSGKSGGSFQNLHCL